MSVPNSTMTVGKLKLLIADMPDDALVVHRGARGQEPMSTHDFYEDETKVFRIPVVLVVRP